MRYFILDEATLLPVAVDMLTSMRWRAREERKPNGGLTRVGRTEVMPGITVSTVLLPFDHNWHPASPPLLWETMVFGGPLDGEQERYYTGMAAQAGHYDMVARVRAALAAEAGGGI